MVLWLAADAAAADDGRLEKLICRRSSELTSSVIAETVQVRRRWREAAD